MQTYSKNIDYKRKTGKNAKKIATFVPIIHKKYKTEKSYHGS